MRIDRVGGYVARYAAKNVVAAGLARECEVQLSYSIGSAKPVSIRVRTFGTGKIEDKEIVERLLGVIDFRVGGIVRDLGLRKLPAENPDGFYQKLAAPAPGGLGATISDAATGRVLELEELALD